MATDPVCKMQVEEKAARGGKATYQGKDFFFCSAACKTKFEANPKQYATTK